MGTFVTLVRSERRLAVAVRVRQGQAGTESACWAFDLGFTSVHTQPREHAVLHGSDHPWREFVAMRGGGHL